MLSRLDYSYNNEESIIHRLNPVVKIFGLFIYVLICMLKYDNILFIFNISIVFLLLLLSNINMFKYLKIIWKLKYILIVMYAYMYHKEMTLIDMNILAFKFIFLILYCVLLVYTTTKEDFGKGIARILDLFNIININLKKISCCTTNIFTFFQVWIDTYNELFTNLEIKGIVYSHVDLIGKFKIFLKNIKLIFMKSRENMKIRKNDMKYRFYNENVKSKYKYRKKLCIFDYIFIILNIGMIVFYILKVR